jgi:putative ABC transport system ATP-binding protein
MTQASNTILKFNNVSKSFKANNENIEALKNVTFSLERGKSLSLIGPSGSGKSTLLNLAAGLEKSDSGEIFLGDDLLNTKNEEELAYIRRSRIGFIFQSFRLLGSLSALENAEVPARLLGLNNSRARATQLLKTLGLSHRLNHYPSQLSGGEQQRVAIARAFISKPELLLADEPSGNLDYENAKVIKNLIFEMQKENSTSILIVTHDLEFASLADSTLEIKAGEISSK